MTNSALRSVYNWKPVQWFTITTGLDYYIRNFYSRFQEARQGTTRFTVNDTSVELSKRAIPDDDTYSQPERTVLEDLISEIRPSDVFWDIGADKGLYTCPTGQIISEGSVIAFEPHPVRRGELKRNLRRNDLSVTIRTEALSDIEGEAEFGYRIEPDSKGGEFIATLTEGDKLVEQDQVTSPTIIKIDVEGAELDVLRGLDKTLTRDECRLVYIELHGRISDFGGTWEELKDYLHDRHFNTEMIAKREAEDFEQPYLKVGKTTV